MAKVLVPLATGFEEIEAVTVIDILRRGGVEVVSASIGDSLAVTGAHGMELKADRLFAEAAKDEYDAIVLPGGGDGTENLRRSDAVLERIRAQKEAGRLNCAICAAPLVLAEAEVIDPGIHVTCYPSVSLDMDRPVAAVPVIADRDIVTGQAPGAAMLFALVVLQTLVGERTARKVARGLVTDVME
ncbi:MAG: DJ-1/PfpI family protein [Kiritimatiellae bacterium]|nr:DJ-1/PfpI family protein [Kiritimatiellia bacterium]